jgi:intracellular sulfur oxidation DsrE/DsrF family protein
MSGKSLFMKFLAPVILVVCSLGTGFACAQSVDLDKAHHILFQVLDDDPVRWTEVLNITDNVEHMLGQEHVTIEIVVHNGGIHMVTMDSALANRISAAQKKGVVFAACAQTMKRHKYTPDDLLAGIKIVPIGVVEIMQKQEAGWTYIRL